MARLTPEDLAQHLPVNVYDANGMLILRSVTAFDPETGEVESYVFNRDGSNAEEAGEGGSVDLKRRVEYYPPPLTWKSITNSEMLRCRGQMWDLEGR